MGHSNEKCFFNPKKQPPVLKETSQVQKTEKQNIGNLQKVQNEKEGKKELEEADEEGFKKFTKKKGRGWIESRWMPKEKIQQSNNRYEVLTDQAGKENTREGTISEDTTNFHSNQVNSKASANNQPQKRSGHQKGIVIKDRNEPEKAKMDELNNKELTAEERWAVIKEGKKIRVQREVQSDYEDEDEDEDMQWLQKKIEAWKAGQQREQMGMEAEGQEKRGSYEEQQNKGKEEDKNQKLEESTAEKILKQNRKRRRSNNTQEEGRERTRYILAIRKLQVDT